jgi:aryl-alcohol dehydrogenase-like predicted oxidoreductase
MQNHYNLLDREGERELIPCCVDQGLGLIPYSPLARGFLAGTRTRDGGSTTLRASADPVQDELYGRDADFDVVDRVRAVAAERAVPPARVALAWVLRQPAVVAPIVGATKVEHVRDAVAATELELSPAELTRLTEAYRPHPLEWTAA